jgi:hypothetical protein
MHDVSPRATDFCRTAAVLLACVFTSLALPATAMDAQPMTRPMLGAHTLLVQTQGEGSTPATSHAIHTQAQGSTLLALVAGYAENGDAPTDSYRNTWKQIGDSVGYNGYDGKFNARAYLALDARGGSDHVVSVMKTARPDGEITVPFIEIRNAGVLQDVAQNYPVPGVMSKIANKLARTWQGGSGSNADSSIALTSGSVTTTGPATLVAVWWGEAWVFSMTAVPDGGFKVIDSFLQLPPNSGVQCAVAVKQVDAAGTYNVTWTGTPAQGAILWLFAFQSGKPQ